MPTRDDAPVGAPCWIDLLTSDPDRSRAFYGELFGWASESAGEEFGGYITFTLGDAAVAGGMANDGSSGAPDTWTVYLAMPDARAAVASAVAHGAQVHVEPMDIGEVGVMALVADPTGAAIAIWQPGTHRGFGVVNEPDTAGWFELHTRDQKAAIQFYEQVFGWDTTVVGDTDEFRYATLGAGDDALAGVMDASSFLPDGVPSHWSVYFRVTSAEETLAKAVALGATVVAPVEDTPYGRLATLADPTGALFKLVA